MARISQVKLSNDNNQYLIEPTLHTSARYENNIYIANLQNFDVAENVFIQVTFSSPNSAGAKLNVNGTGAKDIIYNGGTLVQGIIQDGSTHTLFYDGTNWIIVGDIKINGTGLELSGNTFSVKYGTTAGTAAAGNDPRLSDARTPVAHKHGNIENDGTLGTASRAVVTDDKKKITVADLTFADPSASTTETSLSFIDTISQNSQGKISATKKPLPKVSATSDGIVQKGEAVTGAQTQTTKFLRSDGKWVSPSYTTNTDAKVAQVANTENKEFSILLKSTNNLTSETKSVNFVSTQDKAVTVNPSTGRITAPGGVDGIKWTDISDALGVDNSTTNQWLNKKGDWSTPTAAQIGAAPAVTGGYMPLSGGTMAGTAQIKWADSGTWSNSSATMPVKRGGLYWPGTSDWIELFAEETGRDRLNLIIDVGDDASPSLILRNKGTDAITLTPGNGVVSATSFSGSGASLTSLNASNLASGTVPADRLPVATSDAFGAVKTGNGITNINGIISVTASNLGLSNAMHFIGIATKAITDGGTEDPTIDGYNTKTAGDVVIDKDTRREYVWSTANKWELLGFDASTQYEETTSGNTFISKITQATDGTITAESRSLNTNGEWSGNAATATALTSDAGGTDQPIYFTGGKPTATTYALKATVNNGTAGRLSYYSGDRAISNTTGIQYLSMNSKVTGNRTTAGAIQGLLITGTCYGNDAKYLSSTTTGEFSLGDPGPQIQFGNTEGTAKAAIIYTNHDSNGTAGSSFQFVTDEAPINLVAGGLVAKTRVAIGQRSLNTSYNLYVNGTSYLNGATTINTTTPASSAKGSSQLQICDSSTSAPAAAIELRRGTINNQNGKASWQIINDRALRFAVDYADNATSQATTYNHTILTLDYNDPIGISVNGGGKFTDGLTVGDTSTFNAPITITGSASKAPLTIIGAANDYREGIRIKAYNNWSDIVLGGADLTADKGTSENSWFIGNNNGNFYITRNGSTSSQQAILKCVGNDWSISGTVNGTITNANHVVPIGLVSEDLNEYQNTSATWYYSGGGNTVQNKPTGISAFGMYVYRTADNYRTQELYASNGTKWMRYWDASKWNAWEQVLTSANYDSLITDVSNRFTAPEITATQKMVIHAGKVYSNITGSNVIIGKGTARLFGDGLAISNPATPNDVGWLRVLGTGETDTVFEIATGDDGGAGEQIVVRQYTTSNTVNNEATLLGTSGETNFPVSVTTPAIITDTLSISSTALESHIKFARNNWNYITYPNNSNAALAIGFGTGDNTNQQLVIYQTGTVRPGSNGAQNLGDNSHRWNNIYAKNIILADKEIQYAGTKSTKAMIQFLDNASGTDGNGIKIGGGGLTVIGSGESANVDVGANAATETLYLLSDNSVFVESACQNNSGANRVGIQITTSGHVVPVKAEKSNNNVQNLGAEDNKWANAYATTFNGKLLAEHVAGGKAEIEVTYGDTIDYWWGVGTSNTNHGLWDAKAEKWIIVAAEDNKWSFAGNADTATGISTSGGSTAKFWRGDNTWSDTISGGTLKITNNSNTVSIGSRNTSWCHFENSADIPFYFNNKISVTGQISIYNTTTILKNNELSFSQGGGWYMTDATWIRTFGDKSIYQNTGTMRTDGTFQVGQSGKYVSFSSTGIKLGDTTAASNGAQLTTINGHVVINSAKNTSNSWNEGLRINNGSNNWSTLTLGGDDETTKDSSKATWSLHAHRNDTTNKVSQFYLSYNGSNGAATRITGHANTSGGIGFSIRPHLGIAVDPDTNYALKVSGDSSFTGDLSIGGELTATSGIFSNASATFSSPILTVKNTSDVAWIPTGGFIAPNMAASHWVSIEIGKTLEDKNCGHLSFYYAGNKSTSNRFELGFYNVPSILNVRADKKVGINTTAPSHDLSVNGNTASTTFIVTDGASTPNDKVTLQWNSTDSSLDFVFT